jgi:predicted nucleic acid-binding protein
MPYVLDASVAAAWFFPDEEDATAGDAAALLVADVALVPALFWFEIRNLLVVGERRGRVTPADSALFLMRLDTLPIEVDTVPVSGDVLSLARAHALSAYDAAYLELARRRAVALATLDRRLETAAIRERLRLIGSA